jgi:hypothetical protein
LNEWPQMRDVALAAQDVFNGQTVVGWDFALTDAGPCILEGNSNMDVSFIQRCYRTPIGSSPLAGMFEDHLDMIVAERVRQHLPARRRFADSLSRS